MRPAFGDVAGVVVMYVSTLALRVTYNGPHHAATNGYTIAPPPSVEDGAHGYLTTS
jgi:hypothetical protein